MNQVMKQHVPMRRVRDFCLCGNCDTLPYDASAREMYCCSDSLLIGNTSPYIRNLKNFMEKEEVQCITDSPSFMKHCLDSEVRVRKNVFMFIFVTESCNAS